MSLKPEHSVLLAEELKLSRYDKLSAADAYAALHAPEVVVTTTTRLVPMTVQGFLSTMDKKSLTLLVTNPNLIDIRDKIIAQDVNGVALWGQLLLLADVISQAEHDAITAMISRTETIESKVNGLPHVCSAFAGVDGFPNAVDRADFDVAWEAAGRKV